jgi:hypothetical protein
MCHAANSYTITALSSAKEAEHHRCVCQQAVSPATAQEHAQEATASHSYKTSRQASKQAQLADCDWHA